MTDDYTPTTGQVRNAATGFTAWEPRQFDAWLTAHDAEVAERIAQAIERRKRDMAEGYADMARAMLEMGMEEAARIARKVGKQ